MKIVKLKTVDGRIRYYLAYDTGAPVSPVLKYLKFKDNTGYARNTLRMHCIHLKHFFTYLGEAGKDYEQVNIDDLAGFLAWLKNPDILKKVVPIRFEPEHQPQTINAMVDTIVMFYDYLLRHEGMENQLSEKLAKFVRDPGRNYRSFLHGIAENRRIKSHILKLPVPRMQLRTISKENATVLLNSCTNLRDYLLLYLLFETGMRIGEALSLWLEDFDMAGLTITLHDRGELENQAEIKTVSSPRRLDCTQELMDLFTEYICEHHTAEIHTNHVFLKLKGAMKGSAMDYTDVDNLFRSLRKKTSIRVTPHMFRHTSLSLLYSAGWEPEMLKHRAGHKNIYTTLDTYVHPSEEEVAEAFRKVTESLKIPSMGREAGQ
ncbi:tyrosine-type recombinase/integrase [Desulfitibacter alkalitolerans]|uniref:tyrosine-type recombinase/integrase n=1 Tax=Desulfitibacter alkalitolerans TaxID=264641 RepID=UPI000483975E|nr:tyrosine-type recombinase/integrase [Desulfitibacter alkalitolerans]